MEPFPADGTVESTFSTTTGSCLLKVALDTSGLISTSKKRLCKGRLPHFLQCMIMSFRYIIYIAAKKNKDFPDLVEMESGFDFCFPVPGLNSL